MLISKLFFWKTERNKKTPFYFYTINPLSLNVTKMVKHTRTIHRLLPTNCLSVFDHFVDLALKGLSLYQAGPAHLDVTIIIHTHAIQQFIRLK